MPGKIIILIVYLLNLPLHFIGRMVPRDRDLWIFGARQGQAFAENPKYFFLYVRRNHPGIRAVWLTRNRRVRDRLRQEGHRAYMTHGLKGYWLSMRAGAAFFSSLRFMPSDLNIYAWDRKIMLVQLWHGSPVKRIIHDDPGSKFGKGGPAERLLCLLFPFHRLLGVPFFSMSIAASPEVRKRLCSAFRMDPEDIPVTGYPKNDRQADFGQGVKGDILYAPTFRRGGLSFLEEAGFDPERINSFLESRKCRLFVKLHYYDMKQEHGLDRMIEGYDRIVLLKCDDIYEILDRFDALITDYSSLLFDFLLMDRPVLFAPFDLDCYREAEAGLYYRYDEISPGPVAQDWEELLSALDEVLSGPDRYIAKRKALCERFNSFRDKQSSERLFSEVRARLDRKGLY